MDNLTHGLTGALIARTLPRAWAGGVQEDDPAFDPDRPRPGVWLSWAAVVAANLPDFEALILWPPPLGDKAAYLMHHRGWSHSLVGIAGEVVAFAGLLWLLSRWRRTARWFVGFTPRRGLVVTALGAFSNLFLDWWNSYGVRPFYPWDKTWYYGDLVFIVDPWVWLMLGGALVCGTRRFGRSLWWWYALTAGGTAIVAAACWKQQCPWWVLIAWCTGVTEIALLRWWGRWRGAAWTGWTLAGLYLIAAALLRAPAEAAVVREYEKTLDWSNERLTPVAALPVPGVPWQRDVIAVEQFQDIDPSVRKLHYRLTRWAPPGLPIHRPPVRLKMGGDPHLFPSVMDPERILRIGPVDDAVRAWVAFARFPVRIGVWNDRTGYRMSGGDARYALRGDDWSRLPLPADSPVYFLGAWEKIPPGGREDLWLPPKR